MSDDEKDFMKWTENAASGTIPKAKPKPFVGDHAGETTASANTPTVDEMRRLNAQIADMRADEENYRHHRNKVIGWVVGVIVAIALIAWGVTAAVNDVNYHKEQYNKAVDETACSIYPRAIERQDCEKAGSDNYNVDDDPNVNGGY